MTDQEPVARWQGTIVIGGERAMAEKNQKATTNEVKERHSTTKQQGPSLTIRDDIVKTSESERQQQSTEIHVNWFIFSSKRTCDTLSNFL
jgi:hypothetical protein